MLTNNLFILSLSLLIFNISNCYTMEDLPKQNNNNISQNIINIENEPAPEPCNNKNDININAITIYTDPIMLRDYVISNKKKIINPKELSVEEIWGMYNGLQKLLPIKPYRVI